MTCNEDDAAESRDGQEEHPQQSPPPIAQPFQQFPAQLGQQLQQFPTQLGQRMQQQVTQMMRPIETQPPVDPNNQT